jgi:hypothetical protein
MTRDSPSSQTLADGLTHEALMYHDEHELEQALREFLAAAAAGAGARSPPPSPSMPFAEGPSPAPGARSSRRVEA